MNDSTLIRLENLRALGKSPAELTALVGNSKQYWSDMLRGRKSFGETAARKIEEKLELPRLFLDEDHSALESTQNESINAKIGAAGEMSKDIAGQDVSDGARTDSDVNLSHTDGNLCQLIPTSMPYAPTHLKSAILLMGSLLGALDHRSKKLIGDMLKDLALSSDNKEEIEDIADKAASLARVQRPVTANMELNRAIRGRGDAVETGPAPLERHK